MNTVEQLASYGVFSTEVIEQVDEAMAEVASFDSYGKLFDAAGVTESQIVRFDGYHPIELVDRYPEDCDPTEVLLWHQGIGNPLDPNNLYQLSALGLVLPNHRILAAANPSGPGYNSGLLTHEQRKRAINGDTKVYVEPLLKYLDGSIVEQVEQASFSFGNEKMLAVAKYVDALVGNCVAIEPASGVERGIVKLGMAAGSTGKALKGYVEANELPTFEAARKESVGAVSVSLGSLRPTNLAVSRQMGRGEYEKTAAEVLEANPAMALSLYWGTLSELVVDEPMTETLKRLQAQFGPRRARGTRLEGQKHMMVNYLPLQLAIILDGLNTPNY